MTRINAAMAVSMVLLLSACGSSGQDELQEWMSEQKAQTKPQIQPIPEPKKFVPQAYTQEASTDPFSKQKLTQALTRESAQSASNAALVAPELARRKEPLEGFPLDSMAMVGSLAKEGQPVALVRVDNLLYQVRPGNYLGQNFGKIVKVAETEVVLREIVQDAAGEWIERTSQIATAREVEMNKNWTTWQRACALAGVFLAAGWSFAARAETAVEGVSSSMQGGVEVVRIDFSQPLPAVPTGFTVQSPARIALDIPGATNGMGRSTVDINQGNVRSVNVVQSGDRSRLVLNLKSASGYKAQLQGKSLLVVLESAATAGPATSAQPVFAESRNVETQPIRDLDFRRGADSSGRVIVALPNNQVGVDIRQQGQTLVVEFLKSTLPEGLRRRLDVTDFGTPVNTVTTFQAGDRVRMVIEPKGAWEHSAYQSDNQFVVEVRQIKVDPSKLTQGPGYGGEKLSLNFQNIEVRSLLQVIADFTNFNIVTSDSVTGAVTLRLKDVPWDQALDIVLQAKGLGMRKTGNVIWIAPKDEIASKEKLDLESRAAIQNLEPVRTQSFQLNYTKAADIAAQLTAGTGAARILSTRGSVIAEPRTNQVFVTDITSRLEQVQQLIGKLDIAVRQVLIEARIVEASDTFGKSLGVRLGGRPFSLNGGRNAQFGPTYTVARASTDACRPAPRY